MSTHKILFLFERLSGNLFKEQRFVFAGADKPKAESPQSEAEKAAALERKKAEERDNKKGARGGEGAEIADKTADPIKQLKEDLATLDKAKFDKIIKEQIEKKVKLDDKQIQALAEFADSHDPKENVKKLFDQYTDGNLSLDQFNVVTVGIFLKNIGPKDKKIFIEKSAQIGKIAEIFIKAAESDEATLKQIFDEIKSKDTIKKINAESLKTIANKLNSKDFTELLSKISKEQKGELLKTGLNDERKEDALNSILKDIKSLSELDTKTCDNVIDYLCSNKSPEDINKILSKTLDDKACENLSKESVRLLLNKKSSIFIYKKIIEKANAKVKEELAKDKNLNPEIVKDLTAPAVDKKENKDSKSEVSPKIKDYIDALDVISADFEKKTAPAEITDLETRKDVELYYKKAATSIKGIVEHHKKFTGTKLGDKTDYLISEKDLTDSFKTDWDKDDTSKIKAKDDFTKTISNKLEQKAKNTAAEIAKEKPEDRKKTAEYVNKLLEAFQKISDRNGFMKKTENTLSKCLSSLSDKADRTEPRTALKDIETDYELWGVKYIEAFKSSEKIEKTIQLIIAKALSKDIKDPAVTELLIDTFGGEEKVTPKAEEPAVDAKKPAGGEQPATKAEDKKEENRPATEEKGEEVKPKIEKFTKEMSLKEMLESSEFEVKDRRIKWKFEAIDSDRSIMFSKKFQKVLNAKDASGNLVNDTPDKVRLCVYKYLWDVIYKGGAVKNKYKKANFEESQQYLQDEISRLDAAIKGKPAADEANKKAEEAAEKAKPAEDLIKDKEPVTQAKFDEIIKNEKVSQNDLNKLAKFALESKDGKNTEALIKACTGTAEMADKLIKAFAGNKAALDKLYAALKANKITTEQLTPESKVSLRRQIVEENVRKGQTLEQAEAAADAKTAAPKAPKYKDYKEAKEALDKRTGQKLEEIRKIASETAGERTIKISDKPSKDNTSEQVHDIEIDGKPTAFKLEIYKDIHSDKVEFRFRQPSERVAFGEYSNKTVATKFQEMLDKIPNNREVKDFDGAIKAAEKGVKIEVKEPKKITVNQLKVLENSRDGIRNSIHNGGNLFDTLEEMKKFAKEGQSVLSGSPITKVTFDTTPAIVWDVQNKDAPFGKEDALTASILAIKEKELGGKETDEYKDFKEKTSTKETEVISKADELARTKEYRQKYGELTDKNFTLKIGSLSRDEMVEKWSNIGGHVKADKIMSHPPFSLNADGETAKVAADTISEWRNDKVDFADVFKLAKDVPEIKAMGLIPLMEDGPGEFVKVFDKLLKEQEAGKLTSKVLQEQLEVMFTKVIVPCLELLKAFEELQMPKETKKVKEEEPQGEQKEIMDALKKLCNFNDTKNSGWSEFLASAYGGKSKLTMSDINGKTFTIDKGQFHNNYDPKAALAILTNINEDQNKDGAPDHYSFNDKGAKLLNKAVMLGEINNRIKLGVINIVMAEAGQKGSKLEGKDLNLEIKSRLANYQVSDLNKITPEQIKAFQIGFVIGQASKFAEKIADAKQALAESSDNPTIKNHPLFKQMASSLLDQGVSPAKVRAIQEKVLFAAGASFKSVNGGSYKFEGAGIGTKIDIGDGMSVFIGLGANTDGKVVAGVGLSVRIYRGDNVEASFVAEIGITGAALGVAATEKLGKVKLHEFVGFRWSWDSIIPTTGGGMGLSWDMDEQLKADLAAAEGKTDYSKVWNEWKTINKYDIDAKYAKLAEIPRLWRPIEAIQKEFGLSKADVINIVEGIKEQLTDKVMRNLSSPIPLFSYAGFALLGPIPVPHVGFKLGSASISIPNRRAISKILHELSDVTVTNALRKAVAEIDNKEKIPRFVEQTGKLIYARDGKLMNLVKSESIDFSQFPQGGIDTHNKALKRAEMKLTKNENGTTALKVLGTDMKDVEIHIDPKLTELGIIKDGANILIEGNIDDLIISRERFELPFETTKGNASIRDVITIRQTGSIRGNRDSTWIQTYESSFLQKLEKEAEFSMQTGNNDKHPQKNIQEIAGYSTKAAAEIGKLEGMKAFIDKRPNMEGRLDAKQVEELGKAASRRREAMEKRGVAMKIKEYEKLQVRDNLFDDLAKSFPKKNEFTKEFQSNIDTPEELVKTLVKFSDSIGLPKLNEKEINLSITHLTNLHYTNVYKESTTHKADGTEEISTSEIRRINKAISKGMEKKIAWVKKEVLLPKFKETLEGIKPSLGFSAEQLVDKLINDTYNPLREKLNDPDFDFRKIKVELIPGGAYLFSGSRQYEKGKREGALSQNINYETLPKDKQLLLGFGLLKGTTGSYKLDSEKADEKALARVILEISSPIPKEDIEFLESPLALKFAGLNSGVLLCFNEGNKFDDYAKITEVYEKPELLQTSPAHKEAVGRFRKLIEEVRACQVNGKTFGKKIGNTGLRIEIKMSTEIKRGAYSKCTNPSFYAQEDAEVSIYAKGNRVIAQFNTSNEVIDAEASKLFASFGLGVGFRNEKVVVSREGTPEAGPGRSDNQGGGRSNPNGGRPTNENPGRDTSSGRPARSGSEGQGGGSSEGGAAAEKAKEGGAAE